MAIDTFNSETTVVDDTYYVIDGSVPAQLKHKPSSKGDSRFTFHKTVEFVLIQKEDVRLIGTRSRSGLGSSLQLTKTEKKFVRETGRRVQLVIPAGAVAQYFTAARGTSATLCFVACVSANGRTVQLNVMRNGSYGIRSYTR